MNQTQWDVYNLASDALENLIEQLDDYDEVEGLGQMLGERFDERLSVIQSRNNGFPPPMEGIVRDFAEVMNRIIDVIPGKHPAKLALSNVVQASYFKAPELMRDCWQSAATVLECMIEPLDRGSEWALKVRDIFAGKEEPCPMKPE